MSGKFWLITVMIFAIAPFVLASDYDKCVMEKIKDAKTETASKAILVLCKEITTPRKCRTNMLSPMVNERIEKYKREYTATHNNRFGFYSTENSKPEKVYVQIYRECIKECDSASFFVRNFGECKTDY